MIFQDLFSVEHLFETKIFCNFINVFIVTFDQFNPFLLNESINFFQKSNRTDPNLLNDIVYYRFKS